LLTSIVAEPPSTPDAVAAFSQGQVLCAPHVAESNEKAHAAIHIHIAVVAFFSQILKTRHSSTSAGTAFRDEHRLDTLTSVRFPIRHSLSSELSDPHSNAPRQRQRPAFEHDGKNQLDDRPETLGNCDD
jgi:hypothetical protein